MTVEHGPSGLLMALFFLIKAHVSRCLSFPPSPPASSWSGRCPQPRNEPQNLLEQFLGHRDLGHLEDDVPGMRDDLGAD